MLSTIAECTSWVQLLSTITEHNCWVQLLSTVVKYSFWVQSCSVLQISSAGCITGPVVRLQGWAALHCTALNYIALHCTAVHCITVVHCSALSCTALFCTKSLKATSLIKCSLENYPLATTLTGWDLNPCHFSMSLAQKPLYQKKQDNILSMSFVYQTLSIW